MSGPQRSPADIAAELKLLKEADASGRDRLSLQHEISVYQEELLVQNQALMQAQSALEETRDQFIELYDFAPNAYVTLDEHGVIRQCNLTAAAFFGRSRAAIEGLPLLGFVTVETRNKYFDFLQRCRSGADGDIEIEATLKTRDRTREAQLLCRPGLHSGRHFFTSIVDITEKKELERERARTADERAALANSLLAAIDEERQRIARNLHDDVGQQLTAIRLKFERMVGAAAAPEADLRSVQHMIEQLDRRLHLIATELRPAALDLGLVTAVTQFVGEWGSAHDISAAFNASRMTDREMPTEIETQLYRIIQEALNNIAKHAAARHVSILLEKKSNEMVLVVEDDGRGFNLEDKRAEATSLGLVGMRERAQMIGGRMHIETAPGEGTSLFVYVPFSGAHRGGEERSPEAPPRPGWLGGEQE
jgi:PAS domain S-box-containing protein